MSTFIDYSYDDRNGPAYPGVNDVAYAERMLAERQLEKDAQAADLGRQDAMINIARGNVPTPAGVVYSNDLGRSGAYRGYAINERNPYANMTARWVTDPSSGQVMFQHLVGANSAQPHFVPGQALPAGVLSEPLLNSVRQDIAGIMSMVPYMPVVRRSGGGGGAGGGGGVGGSGGAKAPTQNNGVIVPQKDPYPPMDMDTMGLFNNNAPASTTSQQPAAVTPGGSSVLYPEIEATGNPATDIGNAGQASPVSLPFNIYEAAKENDVPKLTPEGQWLARNWINLTPFERAGLQNGTLSLASVMNRYPGGLQQTPVVVDVPQTETSRDRAIGYYMSGANVGPI